MIVSRETGYIQHFPVSDAVELCICLCESFTGYLCRLMVSMDYGNLRVAFGSVESVVNYILLPAKQLRNTGCMS